MEVEVGRYTGQNQEGFLTCREMLEHFPSARLKQ